MTDQSSIKVPVLKRDGSWVEWSRKFRARASLYDPPLEKWLKEEPASADATERERENREDGKLKRLMTLAVGGDLVSVVENASSAKSAFKSLQTLCVKAEQVGRSVLSSNVEKLVQGKADTVESYIARARQLMTEAQDLKAVASAEQLCLKVVRGLQPVNKQAVGSTALAAVYANAPDGRDRKIEEARELFESLCSQIASYCELLVQQTEDRSVDDERAAMALQVGAQTQSAPQLSTQTAPQQGIPRDTRKCNHCLEIGHISRVCPKYLAGEPPTRRSHADQQERGADISNEQLLDALVQRLQLRPQQEPPPPQSTAPGAGLQECIPARMYAATAIAGRGGTDSISKDSKAMWMDSGSTHHIACSRDMMVNCTASPVSNVLAAGGESHEVMCCGQIYLQCTTGTEVGLSDVLCVPTLKVNIMSETPDVPRGKHLQV
jgi:hypothetical protein